MNSFGADRDAALATSETTGLPWATMSRLTFLEESIFWTDSVNRRDLIARFGISEQQASGDLTRYQEIAPDLIITPPLEAPVSARG